MSKTVRQQAQAILIDFVKNFATHADDGWWGHDTNLGEQDQAFELAIRRIARIKRRHTIPTQKKYKHYYELHGINRQKLTEAVWGASVPTWWKGSTGEFELLAKAKEMKS